MSSEPTPTIELTYLPPLGGFLPLKGVARSISPTEHRVCVYIRVDGAWWTKPFVDHPTSTIEPDGSFAVEITTGGVDETATEIAVFLVPASYGPPIRRGEPELPPEVFTAALAHVAVRRGSRARA